MPKPQHSKPANQSRVEMTEIILPEDTNHYGNVWGGRIMALIDKAAAIAAIRHSRTNVVRLSHILSLYASVNSAFGSSLEVGVKVLSEDPLSGRRVHCCSAYVTMVSLDADGRPTAVPRLVPVNAADRRRQREARRRRLARLASRQRKRQSRSKRPRTG